MTILLSFDCGTLFSLILALWVGLRCPYLTRRDIFFSITVSPDFPESPEGVAAYRGYRRSTWIHTGIALLLLILGNVGFLLSTNQEIESLIFLVGSSFLSAAWQIGAMHSAFLKARRSIFPYAVPPSTIRVASLVTEPTKHNTALSFLRLGPWVTLGMSALYLRSNWDRIPERFPIHWGANGQVDNWASRSFLGVFGMLIIGAVILLFMEVVMFLCTIGIPRRGTVVKGSRSSELSWIVQATRWPVLGIEYFIAIIIAVLAGYLPVHARSGEMSPFLLIFLSFVFGGIILLFVGNGLFLAWVMNKKNEMRKAEKLAATGGSPTDSPKGDRTEDKCWKCGGTLYYNPNDPAIWVEKRVGIGWTTNMARPAAWVILGALLLLILLFVLVTLWLARSMR
jgi:uncharacterized membrane protein